MQARANMLMISIHTFVREGTWYFLHIITSLKDFNPHLRTRRDSLRSVTIFHIRDFNPHLRTRRDRYI